MHGDDEPEIVAHAETGLLVPPEAPGALATVILSLLEDPARGRAMGEASRRRVEQFINLPKRLSRLEAIYREILQGPGRS